MLQVGLCNQETFNADNIIRLEKQSCRLKAQSSLMINVANTQIAGAHYNGDYRILSCTRGYIWLPKDFIVKYIQVEQTSAPSGAHLITMTSMEINDRSVNTINNNNVYPSLIKTTEDISKYYNNESGIKLKVLSKYLKR